MIRLSRHQAKTVLVQLTDPVQATDYNNDHLAIPTKAAYAMGDFGGAIPGCMQVFFLLFFLTNIAGLDAGLAGSVLLIGKGWDAISDPLIGWLSDRTQSRWGRRYPWMIAGSIPLGICFFLHWVVPPVSGWLLFGYYGLITILFYTAFTAVFLPLGALAAELTQDYDERTSLISFQSAFKIGGSLFALVLAQILFSLFESPQWRYPLLGVLGGLMAIISVYICVLGTRKRYFKQEAKRLEISRPPSLPFLQQIRIAFSNRPFLYAIGIYLCSWLGVQVTVAILPYFIVDYMRLADRHLTQMALLVQGVSLLGMAFWSAIAQKVDKKTVYCLGIPFTMLAGVGLFMLQPGQVLTMYGLGAIAGFGIATAHLVPWSILPDVVDLDELNTGQRREGIFYSFMVMLQKLGIALSLFIVGQILSHAGLLATAGSEKAISQPESVLWAIRLMVGPIPIAFLSMGLLLAYCYPITRTVHGAIRLQLQQRRD